MQLVDFKMRHCKYFLPKGDPSLVCLFMGGSCRDSQAKGQLISGWGAQETTHVALSGG